jgi:hypothetical protein
MADDGDLWIEFARRAAVPFIAGHALIPGETHAVEGLMYSGGATAHDEHYLAQIARWGGKRLKAGDQVSKRAVRHWSGFRGVGERFKFSHKTLDRSQEC